MVLVEFTSGWYARTGTGQRIVLAMDATDGDAGVPEPADGRRAPLGLRRPRGSVRGLAPDAYPHRR